MVLSSLFVLSTSVSDSADTNVTETVFVHLAGCRVGVDFVRDEGPERRVRAL
jgi:hypothetical protein